MTTYEPKTPFVEQRSESRAAAARDVWARMTGRPSVQVLEAERAEIGVVDGFLDASTCLELISRIDANNERSKAYTEGGVDERRTSHSSNFERYEPFVERVDSAIADLLGIAERQGETIQGQRYEPGQFFRPHPDFFLIDEPHWDEVIASGGQRTWTAMVYLNDVVAGGGTKFVELDLEVRPSAGRLLFWNNLDPYGAPNPDTMHEGADVLMGRKYVITKWFREGNWV